MILRVRRVKIIPERVEDYRRFNREQCLPMLRKQPGFLGVFFSCQPSEHVTISITLWEDAGALRSLESSPSYRKATRELAESGLVTDEELVELQDVEGGELRPEALVEALSRTKPRPYRGSRVT